MEFKYDGKSLAANKGDHMVICVREPCMAVACFQDKGSADEDTSVRNKRAKEIGISNRYRVRPRSDGEAVMNK